MTNDSKKYIAPPWIKYPTYPEIASFWRSGTGAEYIIKYNENVDEKEEYLKIFPKAPTFTEEIEPSIELNQATRNYITSKVKPIFLRLWENDGKPKYSVNLKGKTDKVIMYDKLLFDESAHIHIGTNTYHSANEIFEVVKTELSDKSPEIWEELKYTSLVNAIYYKIVTDINFVKELIKTKNRDIIFLSENLELGVEEIDGGYRGKNLLGLAVMELRDVISEVYENYDDIDWDLSGKPNSVERCACMLHHTH